MSTTVPGVIQPTLKPFPEGSNSARTAGIAITDSNVKQQTSLIGTAHGGASPFGIIKRRDGGSKRKGSKRRGSKRRGSKRGGAASTITVPTMQVLYPETGGPDQTVNGNITGTTGLGAKTSTDSNYDACLGQGSSCTAQVDATQKAGARRRKGGVKWGCYSGGQSKRRRKSTKRKKSKKSKKIYRRK